jgi:hypothetical protein
MRRAARRRDHDGMQSDPLIIDLADPNSDDLEVVLLWSRRSGRTCCCTDRS